MRYYNYIVEKKWMKGTMIGFPVKGDLRRIRKYLKSWFIRYKVKYDEVKEPHFTIAQIPGSYKKDELIRKLNELEADISYNPKDLKIFRGVNVPKDFIVIEYKPNFDFLDSFNSVASDFDIRKFDSVRPHVSLFSVEQGRVTNEMMEDIKFSLPKLPKLKTKSVGLWNNKFEMETEI